MKTLYLFLIRKIRERLPGPLLFFIFLSFSQFLPAQKTTVNIVWDSSFSLHQKLEKDRSDWKAHPVIFYDFAHSIAYRQVANDFKKMELLSATNLSHYTLERSIDNRQQVKTWIAKNSQDSIRKIVEVNTAYFIDTVYDGGQRLKDTIVYNNYFIELKEAPYYIHYMTINNQGTKEYTIGDRRITTQRELVLLSLMFMNERVAEENRKLVIQYSPTNQE